MQLLAGRLATKDTNGYGEVELYPNKLDSPKVSESISGLVLHTLHVAGISDLRYQDQNWLSGLPREPPEALDMEHNFTELRGSNIERIDRFAQIKLPWMLIATVDAYPSGDIFQKGRARSWIHAALSKRSVLTADADAKYLVARRGLVCAQVFGNASGEKLLNKAAPYAQVRGRTRDCSALRVENLFCSCTPSASLRSQALNLLKLFSVRPLGPIFGPNLGGHTPGYICASGVGGRIIAYSWLSARR